MNDNLVGKYICGRDENGDCTGFYFAIEHQGWDCYRVYSQDGSEGTLLFDANDRVFDTAEEAEDFVHYLASTAWMVSHERRAMQTERERIKAALPAILERA